MLNLDDVGQRAKHYAELVELWKETVEYLKTIPTASAAMRQEELEVAIALFHNTLENNSTGYHEYFYRKEINSCHKLNPSLSAPTA